MIKYSLLAVLGFALHANAEQVCAISCDRPQDCQKSFFIDGKKIDYYSNFPINQTNNCITRLVVVVHGSERQAESRYDSLLDAAKSLNQQDKSLIIAPYFKTDEDNPTSNDLYWSTSGWKQGNTSNNVGAKISSFAVVDTLINTIAAANKFSALKKVVVTGHSAGGQYSQMYALASTTEKFHANLSFQYVVLNPSNYTYLNELRPYPGRPDYFESPVYQSGTTLRMKPDFQNVAGICPEDYNDFKYGLESRNSYANKLTQSQIIAQYLPRAVYYFIGSLDRDPNDDALDKSCEAKLQGAQRLERGQNYFSLLNRYFTAHRHRFSIIDGIGHDGRGMYNASPIKSVIFD